MPKNSVQTELHMPRSVHVPLWIVVGLFVLFSLIVAFWLTWLHVDESYYIIGAARMLDSGNFLIPETVTGNIRLKKPPLTYYYVVAGYTLLGESFVAAKLFFVASAGGVVVLTFWLARSIGASNVGALIAAASIAGNALFFRAGYTVTPDMPMTLGLTAALLGFAHMLGKENQPAWVPYLAYGGVVFAVLAKGLLALVLVALVFVLRLSFTKTCRPFVPANELLAILVSALASGSWFFWAYREAPKKFIEQFFGDQLGDKVEFDIFGFLNGLAVNSVDVVLGFFPFLLVVILGRVPSVRTAFVSPQAILVLSWVVLVVVVFSFSGFTSERYMVPAMPAFAALIGLVITNVPFADLKKRLIRISRVLGVVPASVGVISVVVLFRSGHLAWALVLFVLVAIASLTLWRVRQPLTAVISLSIMQALVIVAMYPAFRIINSPNVWDVAAEEIRTSQLLPSQVAIVGSDRQNDTRRLFSQIGLKNGPLLEYTFVHQTDPVLTATQVTRKLEDFGLIVTISGPVATELALRGLQLEQKFGAPRDLSFEHLIGAIKSNGSGQMTAHHNQPIYFLRKAKN